MSHVSVSPGAEGGFVRVPRSFVTLPVSPGAKCVLLHLCAAADDNGESWYGYDDIAALIGRSKASVASYVRELVELGLVEAIRQTMANGYNYRRKLRLSGWSDLLAHWAERTRVRAVERKASPNHRENPTTGSDQAETESESSRQKPKSPSLKTERRVQPAERPDPTGPKTKIHQNYTPPRPNAGAEVVWSDFDEMAWKSFRISDKDPLTVCDGKLAPGIAEKINAVITDLEARFGVMTASEAYESALPRLREFARIKQLQAAEEDISKAAKALAGIADTHSAQDAVLVALNTGWKRHWRQLSTPEQIKAMANVAAQAPGAPDPDARTRLCRFRNRRYVAEFHAKQTCLRKGY